MKDRNIEVVPVGGADITIIPSNIKVIPNNHKVP